MHRLQNGVVSSRWKNRASPAEIRLLFQHPAKIPQAYARINPSPSCLRGTERECREAAGDLIFLSCLRGSEYELGNLAEERCFSELPARQCTGFFALRAIAAISELPAPQ